MQSRSISMPLGIVIRKTPGVTRWAKWHWQAVAVLPGAAQESWRELRRDGDAVEYHAATVDLELWRTDAEAYLTGLSTRVPSIYVIMREALEPDAPQAMEVLLATASPYDAQDYADSGEEVVDLVPMPAALMAWVREFTDQHYEEEVFVKRKRNKSRVDAVEDGVGDARVSQMTDVYRAPSKPGKEPVH